MNSSSEMRWKLRFWSVFVGQSLSLLGSALTQFVLLWWVTDTTGSMSALGTAGMAALLPQAILGPLGGVYADRHNRQLILILTDMVSAGCMIVLIALFQTGCVELWHLYVMMAIRSAMQAFQVPAAAASTAMLVPHYFISTAAGLAQSMQGVIKIGAAPLWPSAPCLSAGHLESMCSQPFWVLCPSCCAPYRSMTHRRLGETGSGCSFDMG